MSYISSNDFVALFAVKSQKEEGSIAGFNTINDKPINRALAAKIIHEFVKKVLKEEESPAWKSATKLKDIYDCRTCVAHIAECYCKGIMDSRCIELKGEVVNVFDLKGYVSEDEAKIYIDRALNPDMRISSQTNEDVKRKAVGNFELFLTEIGDMAKVQVFDVDDEKLPFARIMDNPLSLDCSFDKPIIFVCESGYKSRMAADMAVSVGYEKVYFCKREDVNRLSSKATK